MNSVAATGVPYVQIRCMTMDDSVLLFLRRSCSKLEVRQNAARATI
jgi:hypothetical protein